MKLEQFDYHLPSELIAQTPAEPRDSSRLMVINRQSGQISHHIFTEIVNYLQSGDLLIANNSRVIPARLFGRKPTGGKVEILLLKQVDNLHWQALVGGKRLTPGTLINLDSTQSPSPTPHPSTRNPQSPVSNLQSPISQSPNLPISSLQSPVSSPQSPLSLTIEQDLGQARRLIKFNQPIDAHLEIIGHVPLPPYIQTPLSDSERYQTVFSRIDGSAAAPTAGLHFTPELLLTLRNQGVGLDYVTLHIGLDTFKPVTVEQIENHTIHREVTHLNVDTARRINQTKLAGGRLVAVGTTSVRTLETAALRSAGVTGSLKEVSQLDADLCPWQPVVAINEETDLYIYPGYTFRAVDMMLTNFHLPKSTLLMLVSAFAGDELIREAYNLAIAEKYRFYSFGDAMLIV